MPASEGARVGSVPADAEGEVAVLDASDVVAIALLAGIAATLALWLIHRPMP